MWWPSAFHADPVVVKTEFMEPVIPPVSFCTTGIAVLSAKVSHRAKVNKPIHAKKTLFGVALFILGLALSSGIFDDNIKDIKASGSVAIEHIKATAPVFKDSLRTSGVVVLKKIQGAPASLRTSRRLVIKRVQVAIAAAPGVSESIQTSGGIMISNVQARIEAFSRSFSKSRNTVPSLPAGPVTVLSNDPSLVISRRASRIYHVAFLPRPVVPLKKIYPTSPARDSAGWLTSRRDILQGGVNITSYGFGDAVVCPYKLYEPIAENLVEGNVKLLFWETLGYILMAISTCKMVSQIYRYLASSWKPLLHCCTFLRACGAPRELDPKSEFTFSSRRCTKTGNYYFTPDSFTATLLPDLPDYSWVFWKKAGPVVGGHPFYLTLDSTIFPRLPKPPTSISPSPTDDVPLPFLPIVVQEVSTTKEVAGELTEPVLFVEEPDVEPQAAPQVTTKEAVEVPWSGAPPLVEEADVIVESSSTSSEGCGPNPSVGEFISEGLQASIHASPPKVTVARRSSEIGRRRRQRTRQNKRARRDSDEEEVVDEDAVPNWATA